MIKQILNYVASLSIVASSITSATAWINSENYNLQEYESSNKAEANEYGDPTKLIPGTSHQYHWYLRFYITPAIYNVLNLTAKEVLKGEIPVVAFYNIFLGDNSKNYPSWYENAVSQYKTIVNQYNAIYYVDFNMIFKNWLSQNYKYFFNVLLGKEFKTDIYKYPNMPPGVTPQIRKIFLQKVWRKNGIVMNIPFTYDPKLATTNKWTIDKTNLRLFPQIEGIQTIFYYYTLYDSSDNTPPVILLPNKTSAKVFLLKILKMKCYRHFLKL